MDETPPGGTRQRILTTGWLISRTKFDPCAFPFSFKWDVAGIAGVTGCSRGSDWTDFEFEIPFPALNKDFEDLILVAEAVGVSDCTLEDFVGCGVDAGGVEG